MSDPVIQKALAIFKRSGKSLEQLGQEMGYPEGVARRAAWQFFNKVDDPRLSTLRRFAKAMKIDVKKLL